MRLSTVVTQVVSSGLLLLLFGCARASEVCEPIKIVVDDFGLHRAYAVAPDSACREGNLQSCGRALPDTLTAGWFREHIMRCDFEEHEVGCRTLRQAALSRRDLVNILITAVRDSAAEDLLPALAATRHERAYDFLLTYSPRQRDFSPRAAAVESFGFGGGPAPQRVYRALADTLRKAALPERSGAVDALRRIGTEQARRIMRAHHPQETSPWLRRHIMCTLQDWKPNHL